MDNYYIISHPLVVNFFSSQSLFMGSHLFLIANLNRKRLVLCDYLEGWDREGGREAQEGGDMGTCVYIWLILFVVQQKLTQYCEAIILQ